MDYCMITFRSVTSAQRAENLLRKEGIACILQRTPRVLADQGCGYSIRLKYGYLHRATELLRQKGVAYRKAYTMEEGSPREVSM